MDGTQSKQAEVGVTAHQNDFRLFDSTRTGCGFHLLHECGGQMTRTLVLLFYLHMCWKMSTLND